MSITRIAPSRPIHWLYALIAIALAQAIGNPSKAALIPILAPPSVLPGALQSQTDGYIFLESLSTLAAPLPVDIDVPGLYNMNQPGAPGVIPQGTQVLSYMIHHESVDLQISSIAGGFFFPHPIIGVIYGDTALDLTDPILGNPGTSYPTGLAYRGFDLAYPTLPDTIFWSGNMLLIGVRSNTQLVLDQLRVIVSVPEPSTIGLAALAGCCLFWTGRRRLQRK